MQVVEHEHDLARLAHPRQPCRHRLELPVAGGPGVGVEGLVPARQALARLGHERAQLGAEVAHAVEGRHRGAVGQQRLQRLDEGAVRGAVALVAVPGQHHGSLGVGGGRQAGHEAGLADARLPGHERHRALAGPGPGPGGLEGGELDPAADELVGVGARHQ